MKLIQNEMEEKNEMMRRIYLLVELQQSRERVKLNMQENHNKKKENFDKRASEINFYPGDLILKWDARREDKGNHHKFDHIWMGPFRSHMSEETLYIFFLN